MVGRSKLLSAMIRNPAADWTMRDIQTLCREFGWQCLPPSGGSHWKIVIPGRAHILTIPARRPIKPIYIRKITALAKEESDE